jgi:hypothetical protein
MGMHLEQLPSGEIVEVWDRPEPAKPTVHTLGADPESVCHCFCHVRMPGEVEGPGRDAGCDDCFEPHFTGKIQHVVKVVTGMTLMPYGEDD